VIDCSVFDYSSCFDSIESRWASVMIHHEGTKATKDTKPRHRTHKKLWVDGEGFVSFVAFVPSW